MNIHISSHLKEQLAWVVVKWLRVINTLKNNKSTKDKAVLNLEQCCICCYVALSKVF